MVYEIFAKLTILIRIVIIISLQYYLEREKGAKSTVNVCSGRIIVRLCVCVCVWEREKSKLARERKVFSANDLIVQQYTAGADEVACHRDYSTINNNNTIVCTDDQAAVVIQVGVMCSGISICNKRHTYVSTHIACSICIWGWGVTC